MKNETLSLPRELHAATRVEHRNLNSQIIEKLPLCLPPATESPLVYAQGMVVFGQIYFAFEDYLVSSFENGDMNSSLHSTCARIQLSRLLRTKRLRKDIEVLKFRLGVEASRELTRLARDAKSFSLRVKESLSQQPHVLLAYMWTMYLALFNGGRWIHGQLQSAGASFWRGEHLPLSFWEFEDVDGRPSDGEDLKRALKEAFADTTMDSDTQMHEVIQESKKLFGICSEMVDYLHDQAVPLVVASLDAPRALHESPTSHERAISEDSPLWNYINSVATSVKESAQPCGAGNN